MHNDKKISWTIEKVEHQRIDAARRSNQSILKEINPEYSLEGMMLKLELEYFDHLMQRADSLEKTWCWERLRVGGEEGDRGWDGWMVSLTQWTWIWANSGRQWKTGKPGVLQSRGWQTVRYDLVTKQQDTYKIYRLSCTFFLCIIHFCILGPACQTIHRPFWGFCVNELGFHMNISQKMVYSYL